MLSRISLSIIFPGLLCFLVIVCYWPVLNGEFFFDDNGYIIGNQIVMAPDGLKKIWRGDGMVDYWPLSFSAFWLEWKIFGNNPFGYHIVNLMLHISTSLLIWRILLHLQVQASWLYSLLFAIHPANSLTASWIFQTRTTLAGFLCALAINAWLRFRLKNKLLDGTITWLYFTLSLLAKPIGIIMPLFGLYSELVTESKNRRKLFYLLFACISISIILGSVGLWFQNWKKTATDEFLLAWSLPEQLRNIIFAYGFYIRLAFVPSPLMLIHPNWNSLSEQPWTFTTNCILFIAILSVIFMGWHYSHWRRSGLAATWFVAALLPSTGIVYIPFFKYAPVSEHYLYIALPGALVLLSEAIRFTHFKGIKRVPIILFLLNGLYGFISHQRAIIYSKEQSVWNDVITKNPKSWLAYYNLGVRYYQSNQKSMANLAFENALSLHPQLAEASYNLGVLAFEEKDLTKSIGHLLHSVTLRPDFCTARNLLASIHFWQLNISDAISQWEIVIKNCPTFAEAHYNLGVALARISQNQSAKFHLTRSIKLEPFFQETRFNVASLFILQEKARLLLDAIDKKLAPE